MMSGAAGPSRGVASIAEGIRAERLDSTQSAQEASAILQALRRGAEQADRVAVLHLGPAVEGRDERRLRREVELGILRRDLLEADDVPAAEGERAVRSWRRVARDEDLARAALVDLLGTPDAEFRAAAARILQKNRELYTRLA